MGMLLLLGLDVLSSWEGIFVGCSGIVLIEYMDLFVYFICFGGLVKGFNVEEYLFVKEVCKFDLFIQYGFVVSFQVVCDFGLEVIDVNCECIGVFMGFGIGGLINIENNC